MTSNFLLSDILTDFQLKLLELIQYLRESLKGAEQKNLHRSREPILTLQYGYIVSLFECSHSTVKIALDKLAELELIKPISNNFGECATYQYNPSAYTSLIKNAKIRNCILITGRSKQRKEVTANEILKYMTGKAIIKANKRK